MLGLSADDILDGAWRPKAVGWNTAFHVVPVRGLAAARRTRLRLMFGSGCSRMPGRRRST